MTISKGLSERCEELETVVSLKQNLLNEAFFIVFSRLCCSNYQQHMCFKDFQFKGEEGGGEEKHKSTR